MMQGGEGSPLLLSLSPSFSSYSSSRFAEIAARVVDEFCKETDSDHSDIFDWKIPGVAPESELQFNLGLPQHEAVVDDDFEFALAPTEPHSETISAEDIFHNGQIRPIYPVFNASLLLNDGSIIVNKNSNVVEGEDHDDDGGDGGDGGLMKPNPPKRAHRPSLGKLMSEDQREASSCSSSEADELDGALPGTYCVWSPKESLERCKKSNSMGSSKRWKLRDLLYRSNSDGKDTFVFLAQTSRKIAEVSNEKEKGSSGTGDEKTTGKVKSSRVAAAAAATTVTEDNT